MSNTSCKDCVFAEYEEVTQTGCRMNMIKKYSNNENIIECYDEEKEFFVIKARICPYMRTKLWKDRIDKYIKDNEEFDHSRVVFDDDTNRLIEQLIKMAKESKVKGYHL